MDTWKRRVLVVEDSALLGSLLSEALTAAGFDVEVAADVASAMSAVDSFDPDAALLDVDLGSGPSGLDLATSLRRDRPDIAVVFLTRYADLRVVEGRDPLPSDFAFVSKDRLADIDELVSVLEVALRGRGKRVRHDLDAPAELAHLTRTQREVVRMAALGYTNTAIARERGTSERAVEMVLRDAATRMRVANSADINPRVALVRAYLGLTGEAHPYDG